MTKELTRELKTVLSNCDAKRDHNYREGADSFTITTKWDLGFYEHENDSWHWWKGDATVEADMPPTHWMPLPPSPRATAEPIYDETVIQARAMAEPTHICGGELRQWSVDQCGLCGDGPIHNPSAAQQKEGK